MDHYHHCSLTNLDGEHARVEMHLTSLFVEDYVMHEEVLVASNGLLSYRCVKSSSGIDTFVCLVSVCEPEKRFKVTYGSAPFRVNTRSIDRELFDVSKLVVNH